MSSSLFNPKKRLAVFDRLTVLDVDFHHFAACLGLDFVHQLHGLDDANHRVGRDAAADVHEALSGWRRRAEERTDDWRSDLVKALVFGGGLFRLRPRVWWSRARRALGGLA